MFLKPTQNFIKCLRIHYITIRCINTEINAQNLFVNVLGMNEETAQNFIEKHQINTLEPKKLQDTVNFIKKHKYKISEIIKNPKIFEQKGKKTWQHYYDYFKDCGCKEVPIASILNFRRIRYSTIAELKELGVIPNDTIVVQNLVNQLDWPLNEEDISNLRNDNLTLSYVHRAVTHKYLMSRLGASMDDLEKISRLHSNIYNKSLKALCENVNLALKIGYTKEKILRNAYILQTNPQRTKDLLKSMPNFLNCDMKTKLKNHPKLMGISLEKVQTIYDILKKYEFSDETIAKAVNIFTLSPQTVEQRLKDVKSQPETRLLMNNPHVLRLIVHYHRAQSRLQFLHKVRLKCTSLVVIGFDGDVFDNYIKEGKDMNKRKEASNFLCALLKCAKDQVDVNFRKHPYYLYVPFVDIEHTYNFLRRNCRFQNEHIIKAISILLYPKEKIAAVLDIIREDHYLSTRKPRANKSQILNLALYYLEKDHHFTGNGIWRVNEDYVQTLQ